MLIIFCIKRIDIYRKPEAVSGDRLRIRDKAKIKTRGIVIRHRCFIVRIILVNKSHLLDHNKSLRCFLTEHIARDIVRMICHTLKVDKKI